MTEGHRWTFRQRFRRGAFGWRSQPAIKRVKEAVSEIRAARRHDPELAAEGAVLLLEKISPALENVDSSSGAIGTAVNRAIDELVPIIIAAAGDRDAHQRRLERLWQAHMDDEIPYIEALGERWGELCASPEVASTWADLTADTLRSTWGGGPGPRPFFKGTSACLSSLYAAGRYDEVLGLLDLAPTTIWAWEQWAVRSLVALGRKAEALQRAEAARGSYASPTAIARACEKILLSSGLVDEAYRRFAFDAHRTTTYLATFRAVCKAYPDKDPREILMDLAATTPGEEGKWFAAAKDAGLRDLALELAATSPTDPRTLSRAARDLAATDPVFAVGAGLAALHWLLEGHGYEITSADVHVALDHTLGAAEIAGRPDETRRSILSMIENAGGADGFVGGILARRLAGRPHQRTDLPSGDLLDLLARELRGRRGS